MRIRTSLAASAAAALFLAGLAGAAHAEEPGAEAKIKCEGVNSCKGHGECKSAANACKGTIMLNSSSWKRWRCAGVARVWQ